MARDAERIDLDVRRLVKDDPEAWEVVFQRSPLRTKMLGFIWGCLGVGLVLAGCAILVNLIKGWITGGAPSVAAIVATVLFGLLLTIGGAVLSWTSLMDLFLGLRVYRGTVDSKWKEGGRKGAPSYFFVGAGGHRFNVTEALKAAGRRLEVGCPLVAEHTAGGDHLATLLVRKHGT